jgi:tetratricopeptide (TPR) repeat protein
LRYYLDALNILEEDKSQHNDLQSTILHNAGSIYSSWQDYRTAQKFLKSAIELRSTSSIANTNELTAKCLHLLGSVEFYLNELDSSLMNLKYASQLFLKIYGKKSLSVLSSFIRLAKTYARRHENRLAIGCLSEALFLWDELKNIEIFSMEIYMSFGEMYLELRDLNKATEYFEGALQLESTKADDQFLYKLNMHLAEIECKRGNFTRSRYHGGRAIELKEKSSGSSNTEYAMMLEKLGDIESRASNKCKALEHYNKAILIREAINDEENSIRLLLVIGSVHLNAGDLEDSLKHFQRLNERTTELNLGNKSYAARAKQGLAYTYFLMSDYDSALKIYTDILCPTTELECLSFSEIVNIHRCIGLIYMSNDEKKKASIHFMQSISVYENFCSSTEEDQGLIISESIVRNVLVAYDQIISMKEIELGGKENLSSIEYGYANALVKVGNFKKASDVFHKILADLELLDHQDLSIAATLQNIGNCNSILGRNSVPFFERSLSILTTIHGENALENSDIMLALAEAHGTNANFSAALMLSQRALKMKIKGFGAESLPVVTTLRSIGQILLSSGENEGSLNALGESLSIQQRHFCVSDDRLSATHFYIGKAHRSRGHYEKGLEFLRKVDIHYDEGCNALLEIAEIHMIRGETDIAQKFYTECFELTQDKLGISSDSGSTLFSSEIVNSDNISLKASRLGQSINFEASKCQHLRKFVNAVNVYGMLFKAADRYEEALTCFFFCAESYRVNDIKGVQFGDVSYEIGNILFGLGKYANASKYLKEALAIFRHAFQNRFNIRLCKTLQLLGDCENKQEHVEDALELLQEVKYWWNLKKKGQQINPKKQEAQDLLLQVGKLHQKKKNYSTALDDFGACLRIAQRLEDSSFWGESIHAVGQLYFESGNYPRAVLNYQHAFDIFNEDSEMVFNTTLSMVCIFICYPNYSEDFLSHSKPLFLFVVRVSYTSK